ncbi:hypothetical protein [Pseudogemmobacter bohemicus]
MSQAPSAVTGPGGARDLLRQAGQYECITNAAIGDLNGPDFQRFRLVFGKTIPLTAS